jgi:hypothetical protein
MISQSVIATGLATIMKPLQHRFVRRSRDSPAYRVQKTLSGVAPAVLASVLISPVNADTFGGVHYDARTDELVATMIYRGTNPSHTFTLQWGVCPEKADSANLYEIAADVLDADWNDVASQTFRKTVHFSVANLACRPAEVTLRTAPRFFYTIIVPRAPAKAGK